MSMINRIALRSARPAMGMAFRPAPIGLRYLSAPADPKQKANSIIDALPGNNLLSKTGVLATSAYGISNGLFIIHDETILLVTFASFTALVAKFVAPLYTEWADGEIKKVNDILNQSRTNHIEAVNKRIETVSELKNVVATTEDLFALSKETAQFEADSFELNLFWTLGLDLNNNKDNWNKNNWLKKSLIKLTKKLLIQNSKTKYWLNLLTKSKNCLLKTR